MDNETGIEVEIFGQAFKVYGGDPGYIRELAQDVDSRMREVADKTRTTDITRLAVLAALNVADEYYSLQQEATKASGEEVRLSQADNFSWQKKRAPQPFTQEERRRVRARRQRHRTRRWCEQQHLKIAEDESLPAEVRQQSLLAIDKSRGYNRPAKPRR